MTEHNFQFHCMICYEEFQNTEQRYPVVLPCGHTYVCASCGEKLDKCMECRESLYMTFSSDTAETVLLPPHLTKGPRGSWGASRSGSSLASAYCSPPKRPAVQKSLKKRLPLPKNVVLLSLIEATHMISSEAHPAPDGHVETTLAPEVTAPMVVNQPQLEDGNKPAILATKVSGGKAGTYAVCCPDGLRIFPTLPDGLVRPSISSPGSGGDDDVDTLVHFFQSDKMRDLQNKNPVLEGEPELATLAYGDRIQVVAVDRGWAKLSRGYGFVPAGKNQIVKVGNTVDKACLLEAMLRSLSDNRRELRIKQSEIDTQFVSLMNHLQVSLQHDEDLTVICRTAFGENENGGSTFESADSDSVTEKKEERNDPAIDKHLPDRSTLTSTENQGGLRRSTHVEPMARVKNVSVSQFSPMNRTASPSPSEMKAGALAWRERQAREKTINFRSGLSCHVALSSGNYAHAHEYLGREQPKGSQGTVGFGHNKVTSFRMSTHTGLTMSHRNKGKSKKSSILSARNSAQDHLKPHGSM